MWTLLRRQLNYFFVGFIAAFVIYLFVRYEFDDIMIGVLIGAVVGVALSAGLYYLERRFPENRPE